VMFGVILIVVMAAMPGGLVDLVARVRWMAGRFADRSEAGSALPERIARP